MFVGVIVVVDVAFVVVGVVVVFLLIHTLDPLISFCVDSFCSFFISSGFRLFFFSFYAVCFFLLLLYSILFSNRCAHQLNRKPCPRRTPRAFAFIHRPPPAVFFNIAYMGAVLVSHVPDPDPSGASGARGARRAAGTGLPIRAPHTPPHLLPPVCIHHMVLTW